MTHRLPNDIGARSVAPKNDVKAPTQGFKGLLLTAAAINLGRKSGQPLSWAGYATASYRVEDMQRRWDPGCVANIPHESSPLDCTPWHSHQSTFHPEGIQAMYEVSSGVRSTRNEDGGIVLDIDHGQMFRLNPVGALILESVAKGCGETEIAQGIAHEYSIREETAIADVREFLKSLEGHRLLHAQHGEKAS